MKPLTRSLFASISMMSSMLLVTAPLAAHAASGSISTSTHGSAPAATASAPVDDGSGNVDDGSLEADTSGVDTSSSSSPSSSSAAAGSIPGATRPGSAVPGVLTPSNDPAADPTAATDDGVGGFFAKITKFISGLVQAVAPVMEFLMMINSFTHWFDGIIPSGATGQVASNNSGNNTNRNTPTTAPNSNPNSPIVASGHGLGSSSNPVSVTPIRPGQVATNGNHQLPGNTTHSMSVAPRNNPHGAGWYRETR